MIALSGESIKRQKYIFILLLCPSVSLFLCFPKSNQLFITLKCVKRLNKNQLIWDL